MLSDISLGRYYDANSIIHRTDPRIKIVMYIVYLVAIFMIKSPWAICALALVTLLQLIAAKIPVRITLSTVMPMVPLALFIFALNVFSIKQGTTIFSWWKLSITDVSLVKAIIMSLRLLFLILSTSVLLTLTTTPLKISDALESLFSPLKVIKVPVHELSMMMSIALRFIPTLIEETDKIMKAQVSRGADYDTGSIINRVKGYVTVLVPLLISSFKRAEELAVAMDARCYRGGDGRTKLNPLKIGRKDIVVGALLLLGAVGIVVFDYIIR